MNAPSPLLTRAVIWALALGPAVGAVLQLGALHPDEVYQSLEPGFFRVHGYGVLAWEWQQGLRNWSLPLMIAFFIRLANALTVTDPQAVRAFIAVPLALLHAAALFAVHRYASRRSASPRAALAATVLFGCYGPILLFAGRTLSETVSAACLVIALERIDLALASGPRSHRAAAFGGAWLGLATVARYGSIPIVLAALLYLAAVRRWQLLGALCLGGAGVALGLGALDAWTWGTPFHSLWAYARFNVFSNQAAASFGAEPAWYFLPKLLLWTSPALWGALCLALLSTRSRPPGEAPSDLQPRTSNGPTVAPPLILATAYLVAISAVAHKELRFLYPALVLLAFAGFPPLAQWLEQQVTARRPKVAVAVFFGCLAIGLPSFSMIEPRRPDQFRATLAVARAHDATGFLLVNEGIWGAGGYFFLGKPIPWGTADFADQPFFQQAMRDPRFNRAVTYEGRALDELQANGFRVIAQLGRATVLERR